MGRLAQNWLPCRSRQRDSLAQHTRKKSKDNPMTTPSLAKIESVDLRIGWPNEARDFTPWLAEHITELGEALGLDLELQQTEAAVGGYSLDILATDVNGSRPVIIENQLETTDHDHLGKLLTYAAGFDANVVVWLTREFRDEHRQALDWLNQRTDEQTQFFGVVVELWKIDGSRPAPYFNLVATPNDWSKGTAQRVWGETPVVTSERSERYRNFFQLLIDTLREEHRFTGARKGQPQSWYSFSSGYRGLSYAASFTWDLQSKVELSIDSQDREWNVQLLERLEERKDRIESEILKSLIWESVEGRRACRIKLERPGTINDDDDALADIREWMVDNLLGFKQVFDPHLKELVG